jgi:prophage regulatory protein
MSEPERILRMRTVLQRTGLSRSTIYRKMKDGTFPCQVAISMHGRGWYESAINRWIADPASYVESSSAATPADGMAQRRAQLHS